MEIIIVFAILALVATFVCLGVISILKGIGRGMAAVSRPTPPPLPRKPAGADAVYAAFTSPYADGSADLCSALPDSLLLEHYRANLGKVASHRGEDLERFSADLAEMLIVHMEIASRFAVMTHNKQHTRR